MRDENMSEKVNNTQGSEERIYKPGWSLLIPMYLIVAALLVGGFFVFKSMLTDNGWERGGNYFWILLWALAAFIVMYMRKLKVSINHEEIRLFGIWSSKAIPRDQILGFRVDEKHTWIEPKDKGTHKRLQITSGLKDYDQMLAFLAENHTDLYAVEAYAETKEVLSDETLGATEEEREMKLNRAMTIAKGFNWVGVAAGLWVLFFPEPYDFAIMIAASIPIIGLVILKFSDGLFRMEPSKTSPYPSVMNGFLLPSAAVFIRTLLDFEIVSYDNVWVMLVAVWLTIVVLIFASLKNVNFSKSDGKKDLIFLAFIFAVWSYGGLIQFNCLFDDSDATMYNVEVVDKHISSGKTTSYYLKLDAWGPRTEAKDASVSESYYEVTEIGDDVTVFYKEGGLKIPWFVVWEGGMEE